MNSEGPLLPRGTSGGTTTTTENVVERRKKHQHDSVDGPLFGQGVSHAKRRHNVVASIAKRTKKKPDTAATTNPSSVITIAHSPPFSLRTVTPNTKLWGIVKNVTPTSATISLPNQQIAMVRLQHVSDEFFDAITAGLDAPATLEDALPRFSFVRCVVLTNHTHASSSTTTHNVMVELSTRASLVNKGVSIKVGEAVYGSIKSLEDHGATLNLGIQGFSGFVPFTQGVFDASTAVVGRCLEGIVVKLVRGIATIQLRDGQAKEKPLAPPISLAGVYPGALVEYSVAKQFHDGGIAAVFLTHFAASLDPQHAGDGHPRSDDDDDDTTTTTHIGRILAINVTSKQVSISALPHLISGNPSFAHDARIGLESEICMDATVREIIPKLGVSLNLNHCTAIALCPTSKLSDTPDTLPTSFRVGHTHTVRVVGESLMDGILIASMQSSVLSSLVLRYEDLKPGQLVKGHVSHVDPAYGLLITLGYGIRGLVPFLHLSETQVQAADLNSRFKVGQMLKARVLTVEASNRRVLLTLKKTLVTGNGDNAIVSYDMVQPGRISYGFVTRVDDFGIIVTFFNNVHGLVPKHAVTGNEFQLGQIVKVRVVSVDPARARMRLSLNLTHVEPTISTSDLTSLLMQNTHATVLSKDDNKGLVVEILIAGSTNQTIRGTLPIEHLSDHPEHCLPIFNNIEIGSMLKNALVLRSDATSTTTPPMLTVKPQLISKRPPASFEDIAMGDEIVGYITNVSPAHGVFVRFGGELTALVPRANLSDLEASKFKLGQTVHASITAVDSIKQRLTATLKPSVVGVSAAGEFLKSRLNERKKLFQVDNLNNEVKKAQFHALKEINLGMECWATVTVKRPQLGLVVEISATTTTPQQTLTGFCPIEQCPTVDLPNLKETLRVRVVDVDFSTGMLDVTARKSLLTSTVTVRARRSDDVPYEGMSEIELVKANAGYVVVSWTSTPGVIVLARCAIQTFNGPLVPDSSLRVGGKIRIKTLDASPLVCVVIDRDSAVIGRPRARSGSISDWQGTSREAVVMNAVLTCRVADISKCWMRVALHRVDKGFVHARVHSCDVLDPPVLGYSPLTMENLHKVKVAQGAFAGISVGDFMKAKVIYMNDGDQDDVRLSLRPSVVEEQQEKQEPIVQWQSVREGGEYDAWVDQVVHDGIWVGLSSFVRAFCFCADVCDDTNVLDALWNDGDVTSTMFPVGRPIKVKVLRIDLTNKRLGVKIIGV